MNENMLPVGTLLRGGTYRIERQLSSGGFGNTYVVRHVEFNEVRAMKEFFMKVVNMRDGVTVTVSVPSNKPAFEALRSKFKKEAQRLRTLSSRHIINVYDLFEENGTVYYIMDYIDGLSLADMVKQYGPMDEKKAMQIFDEMLEALSVVHNQKPQMLHLDIKPANIMVDMTGTSFLLDFGSSKQIDQDHNMTTSPITLTPGYAPSELTDHNKKRIGPWTDLYELGATLYHILTGNQPPTITDISEDGDAAFEFTGNVSDTTRNLILWLMSLSRDKRPKSVEEVWTWMEVHGGTEPEPEPEPNEGGTDGDDEDGNTTIFGGPITGGAEGNDMGVEDDGDEGETIFGTSTPPTEPREPEPPISPEPEEESPTSLGGSNKNNLLYALLGLIVLGVILFFVFGRNKNPQPPVEEAVDSIAEVVDSVVDSLAADDVYWSEEAKAAIDKIMQCIIDGNAQELANMTEYPLGREYPLKDIQDEDEMMAYFNTLFDTNIKNKLRNKTTDDWEKIGWRPYSLDFGGGYLGINEDLKLCYVNYRSTKEENLRKQLVEDDLGSLPESLREGGWKPYLCYLDIQDGSVLRIDQLGEERIRLCVYKPGKPLYEPDICIFGKRDIQGSMGLESDMFTDGKISYDIGVSESMQDGKNYVAVEDKNLNKSWTHEIKKCYWQDLIASFGTKEELSKDMQYIEEALQHMGEVIHPVKLNPVIHNLINGMVYVEGGSFVMGEESNAAFMDEIPIHSVVLSDFHIGKTEVTQEQWQAVMGNKPSRFEGDRKPVENVSWNDCQEFISKLNAMTGKRFRLPTEAEWEYAARGGKKSKKSRYAGGDNLSQQAWYKDNSNSTTHAIATCLPNELGLFDMSGNVKEWCQDWYGEYKNESEYNPVGPRSGSERVIRGGSYYSEPKYMRISCRNHDTPQKKYSDVGFRLAL